MENPFDNTAYSRGQSSSQGQKSARQSFQNRGRTDSWFDPTNIRLVFDEDIPQSSGFGFEEVKKITAPHGASHGAMTTNLTCGGWQPGKFHGGFIDRHSQNITDAGPPDRPFPTMIQSSKLSSPWSLGTAYPSLERSPIKTSYPVYLLNHQPDGLPSSIVVTRGNIGLSSAQFHSSAIAAPRKSDYLSQTITTENMAAELVSKIEGNIDNNSDDTLNSLQFGKAIAAFQSSKEKGQLGSGWRLSTGSADVTTMSTEASRLTSNVGSQFGDHAINNGRVVFPVRQPRGPPSFLDNITPNHKAVGDTVSWHDGRQSNATPRPAPQTQVTQQNLEGMQQIMLRRRPSDDIFVPSVKAATDGASFPIGMDNPNILNQSKNYRGKSTMGSNQNDTIPQDQSCSIWITRIPPLATHFEILDKIHLRGTGRIFSSHVNHADGQHPTSAAKIVFTTAEATKLILRQAVTGPGLHIAGERVSVCYNRHRYHAHIQQCQSRVIRVTGPPKLVNSESLMYFWNFSIELDVLNVVEVGIDPLGHNIMDWYFGSILAQSVAAKMAIEKERGLREAGVRVEYRDDPCQW